MIKLKTFEVGDNPDFNLAAMDPDATPGVLDRASADAYPAKMKTQLIERQQRLYDGNEFGLLLVLQALNTSGQDGTIRNVLRGVNPQGVHVSTFKAPSAVEAAHTGSGTLSPMKRRWPG